MSKPNTKGTPSDVDVHVGQRLRVRRSLLGLSQEKLADAVGVTFQQVQKYERGTNRVSAGRLYELSKVLGVPVTFFFEQMSKGSDRSMAAISGLSDNAQDEFEGQDIMTSKETLELVRCYYAIENPEMRKDIIKFIKAMSDKMS